MPESTRTANNWSLCGMSTPRRRRLRSYPLPISPHARLGIATAVSLQYYPSARAHLAMSDSRRCCTVRVRATACAVVVSGTGSPSATCCSLSLRSSSMPHSTAAIADTTAERIVYDSPPRCGTRSAASGRGVAGLRWGRAVACEWMDWCTCGTAICQTARLTHVGAHGLGHEGGQLLDERRHVAHPAAVRQLLLLVLPAGAKKCTGARLALAWHRPSQWLCPGAKP